MVKKRNRVLALLLAVGLAAGLCGCGGTTNRQSKKPLYEHGLDVIAQIQRLASSDEMIILTMGGFGTNSDAARELMLPISRMDLSEPERVYQIDIDQDSYLDSLTSWWDDMKSRSDLGNPDLDADRISLEQKETILPKRCLDFILNRLNYLADTTAESRIPASLVTSYFVATKTFISNELEKNTIYLYVFEDTAAAVTFTKGEDGTVLAAGRLIPSDDIIGASRSGLRRLLEDAIGGVCEFEVEDVTP